jgi:hypothetical protein
VGLSEAVDTGITYSRSFEEWLAATAAGLDLWRWERDEYPRWFQSRVVAFYRLTRLVGLHSEDAVQRKVKVAANRRGRR